jgi:hypothetical protein
VRPRKRKPLTTAQRCRRWRRKKKAQLPPELKRLMLRYIQLGRLLPEHDDMSSIADFDLSEKAGVKLVLKEMDEVKRAIDEFLNHATPTPLG